MLEIDLVGLGLTWLALISLGSPLLPAGVALLLGELGRPAAVLLYRGELAVLTSGGLFSRWETAFVPPGALAAGAAALPLLAGWVFGREAGKAGVRYALLTAFVWAWEVWQPFH